MGRTSKGDEESSMTWERKARTYGPNFHSVENNHQIPQQNSMFAVIDGENGTGRILSLVLWKGTGTRSLRAWPALSLVYDCVAGIKS